MNNPVLTFHQTIHFFPPKDLFLLGFTNPYCTHLCLHMRALSHAKLNTLATECTLYLHPILYVNPLA